MPNLLLLKFYIEFCWQHMIMSNPNLYSKWYQKNLNWYPKKLLTLRIPTPPMETPDHPNVAPRKGLKTGVFDTPWHFEGFFSLRASFILYDSSKLPLRRMNFCPMPGHPLRMSVVSARRFSWNKHVTCLKNHWWWMLDGGSKWGMGRWQDVVGVQGCYVLLSLALHNYT